jgi:hypothetical protein
MRAASIVFGLLAIGLLGYVGYRYASDHDPSVGIPSPIASPPITVEEPDKDLGSQPCESEVPVRFVVKNVTAQPVRILGLVPCCGINTCCCPKRMDPFVLAPSAEVQVEWEASPGEPGPFKCPMYITYYDGDYQALKLSVQGTWLASRTGDHDSTFP